MKRHSHLKHLSQKMQAFKLSNNKKLELCSLFKYVRNFSRPTRILLERNSDLKCKSMVKVNTKKNKIASNVLTNSFHMLVNIRTMNSVAMEFAVTFITTMVLTISSNRLSYNSNIIVSICKVIIRNINGSFEF